MPALCALENAAGSGLGAAAELLIELWEPPPMMALLAETRHCPSDPIILDVDATPMSC